MCDDPRVAGGPDVLSMSAAPSQAETKHKATKPAYSHCGSHGAMLAKRRIEPWRTQDERGPPKAW
jgi:hypothetical protein